MLERETPELMKKEHTNILFLSRVFSISSRLSVRLKNAQGSGARGRRATKRKNEKRHENNVSLACFSLRVFRSSVQKMAVALPHAIKTFKFLA